MREDLHLAMAMVDAGQNESMNEAFEQWRRSISNAELSENVSAEATALVHAGAGGITWLAHPLLRCGL